MEPIDLDRLDPIGTTNFAYDNFAFYRGKGDVSLQPSEARPPAEISAQDSAEIAVQIKDVTLSYGRHKVLDGINMNVPVSKIYGLLGPSGCGLRSLFWGFSLKSLIDSICR